ncbi:MAG: DUF262 domain-containing protein, partial [Ureaplasma sp.]|nr:DUF262 domain-containing protein [Ureaplasma sp.]
MTKNFNFKNDLYDIDFWFIDFDEYKNNINELEEYIKSRKFNLIPNFIRIFSEKILCNVLNKKNIDLPNSKSIKPLIWTLDDNIGIDREFSPAFHRVADYSNCGSHYNENELDNFEILSLIKSFHLFLVYLLRLEQKNAWLKPEFNIKLYNIDYDNEISKEIISIEKYNEFEKQNDSITKNISIKDVNIYNLLFDKKIFNIPIYQRGYNWNEKNINDLLNDIYLRMNDKTCHYFGVVAGKIIDIKDNITYIKIIDGQQRLTTSILIVMGCYYLLKENNYKDLDKEFNAYFNCLGDINFNKLFQNPGAKEEENNEFEEILSKNYNINNLKRKSNFSTNLNLIINFLRNK